MLFSKGKIKNISKIMNAGMFKPLINIESGIIIVLILGFSLLFAYTLFVKTSIIEGIVDGSNNRNTVEGTDKDTKEKDGDKDKGDKDKGGATHTNQALKNYVSGKKKHTNEIATKAKSSVKHLSNKINPP